MQTQFKNLHELLDHFNVALPVIEKWIEKGSIMVTDEARYYHSVRANFLHVSINHSEGEYVRGDFSTTV